MCDEYFQFVSVPSIVLIFIRKLSDQISMIADLTTSILVRLLKTVFELLIYSHTDVDEFGFPCLLILPSQRFANMVQNIEVDKAFRFSLVGLFLSEFVEIVSFLSNEMSCFIDNSM